jgi:uncharacterized protein YcaQ
VRHLTQAQARRIALAAQGFGRARPVAGSGGVRDIQRVIDTVGVVQIDSVNVLTRSHYLPFFARLGPYDRALLDRARDRAPRRLVEYWAHEAALIPPRTWPLFAQRMEAAQVEAWGGMRRVRDEHPGLVEAVLAQVEAHGPRTSRQVEAALAHDHPRESDNWGWNWSAVKRSLEWLFWSGQVSSAGRTAQFERRYAVPRAVLPTGVDTERTTWTDRHTPGGDAAAVVELVRIAARALGVGTLQCLADYFRLPPRTVAPAIVALVKSGQLEPVSIQGWKRPAYLHATARRPREIHARALVSPFDSLVWQRERTEALFGIRYRLEIYTPAAKRVHGYYVLPFLHGDRIVARCDLKADRGAGVLRLRRLTWEPGSDAGDERALATELGAMAGWLGLGDVVPGTAAQSIAEIASSGAP